MAFDWSSVWMFTSKKNKTKETVDTTTSTQVHLRGLDFIGWFLCSDIHIEHLADAETKEEKMITGPTLAL